jgi:N-acyl-L-homoserine lactone synthetase
MQIAVYDRSTLDQTPALWQSMVHHRKRVFIDGLQWDLPADGEYEIDIYDHEDAIYLIISDDHGCHVASQRLLPTTRPHLMRDHFAHLCMDSIPSGPEYVEVTRVCVSPDLKDQSLRRQLSLYATLAAHEYALVSGLKGLLSVSYKRLMELIVGMGWDVDFLGLPTGFGKDALVASNHLVSADALRRVRTRWGVSRPILRLQAEVLPLAA